MTAQDQSVYLYFTDSDATRVLVCESKENFERTSWSFPVIAGAAATDTEHIESVLRERLGDGLTGLDYREVPSDQGRLRGFVVKLLSFEDLDYHAITRELNEPGFEGAIEDHIMPIQKAIQLINVTPHTEGFKLLSVLAKEANE